MGGKTPIRPKSTFNPAKPLNSTRQEKFCQLLTCGMSQGKAYEDAGYESKTPDIHANQAMKNSKVRARIAYLQAEMAKKHGITRETIALEAEKHRRIAVEQGNLTAANGALAIKARAYGLLTDKIALTDEKPAIVDKDRAKQLLEQSRIINLELAKGAG